MQFIPSYRPFAGLQHNVENALIGLAHHVVNQNMDLS